MIRTFGLIACAALVLSAGDAFAFLQDFEGPAAGTVIAGQQPGGGSAPGTFFAGLTLGVTNTGGGPHTLIIFDSAAPTGGDPDLGTPNVDFGGPGIGSGGSSGEPGENAEALGNLLIVAENIQDTAPADGIVDNPDDEAGGGVIRFHFASPVLAGRIVLVDADEGEETLVRLYNGVDLVGEAEALPLGDNSVQEITSPEPVLCTDAEIITDGSIGVAEIEYSMPPTSTEQKSWGAVKSIFR
jgi:hypothetical protein